MKIRLTGTKSEIDEVIALMKNFLNITTISCFYPNTRGRYSAEGRVYIEIVI